MSGQALAIGFLDRSEVWISRLFLQGIESALRPASNR